MWSRCRETNVTIIITSNNISYYKLHSIVGFGSTLTLEREWRSVALSSLFFLRHVALSWPLLPASASCSFSLEEEEVGTYLCDFKTVSINCCVILPSHFMEVQSNSITDLLLCTTVRPLRTALFHLNFWAKVRYSAFSDSLSPHTSTAVHLPRKHENSECILL